ncbi:MAG: addiction module protein [Flavobacteriaceae bacterium]|nr:addiction module protein [Flavobacteriaceae bacterium]
MSYNMGELLALPDEEKLILANTLWNTVNKIGEDELNMEDVEFIERRLAEHEANPADVMLWNELKEKVYKKTGQTH